MLGDDVMAVVAGVDEGRRAIDDGAREIVAHSLFSEKF
eukprot:XP_001709149.1 Hypothetical protein GL50803_21743 [Giardia lamblia ATCC 50803]